MSKGEREKSGIRTRARFNTWGNCAAQPGKTELCNVVGGEAQKNEKWFQNGLRREWSIDQKLSIKSFFYSTLLKMMMMMTRGYFDVWYISWLVLGTFVSHTVAAEVSLNQVVLLCFGTGYLSGDLCRNSFPSNTTWDRWSWVWVPVPAGSLLKITYSFILLWKYVSCKLREHFFNRSTDFRPSPLTAFAKSL